MRSTQIYSNCAGSLSQDNFSCTYQLTFQGKKYHLSPKELRSLFKSIKNIQLLDLFNGTSEIETIFFPELDLLMVLSIKEVVYLKDLMIGSMCMLELNHILSETIYTPF